MCCMVICSSKLKSYWEFRPWDRKLKTVLESPFSYRDWKRFFFISGEGWETLPNKNLDEAPRFLHQWGTTVSSASFSAPFFCFFCSMLGYTFFFFFFFFSESLSSFEESL